MVESIIGMLEFNLFGIPYVSDSIDVCFCGALWCSG